MVSFKPAASLSNKLNALPKQFKPPPQIAIQSTKNLSFNVKLFINECVCVPKGKKAV